MSEPDMKPCACGCGELVAGTWKRGHSVRGRNGFRAPKPPPLPGPDDDIDLGEIALDDSDDDDLDLPDWLMSSGEPPAEPEADGDEDDGADPAPGFLKVVGGRDTPKAPPRKAARVTAATRKDIEAKIGLMIEIPGRVWAARDPVCGGAFLQAAPEIRPAVAELVLQSPDLVAWFSGAGGGFMLWMNLMVALQPVLMTVWAHHIAHSVSVDTPRPDYAGYAA